MATQMQMRLVSVNVGLPREVVWKGRKVLTGIFKEPVEGPVKVRTLNLEGDRQADLTVHGGPDKAVYVYPAEYYQYWRQEFPEMELPWGMFGENLTAEGGFNEASVLIGDHYQIGTASFVVKQPRLPCYKLGLKFQRDDILKRFLRSGLTGFYLSVLEEGELKAGDEIKLLERDRHGMAVSEVTRLYVQAKHDQEALKRIVEIEALPESWREYFQEQLVNS